MELTREELEEMAAVDMKEIEAASLADLREIEIDTRMPVEKKLTAFAARTGNPYTVKIGDYAVKVSYQDAGPDIDDKLEEYLQRLSEIYI